MRLIYPILVWVRSKIWVIQGTDGSDIGADAVAKDCEAKFG